jgi:hypothetical protein
MEEYEPLTPKDFVKHFDKHKNKWGIVHDVFVELSCAGITMCNLFKNSAGNYTLEYENETGRKRANIYFEDNQVHMKPTHLNVFSVVFDITFM